MPEERTKEGERRVAREDPQMIGEETFEPGKPTEPIDWRSKLSTREERLKFLQTALRYWYGESYGSERRKTPA